MKVEPFLLASTCNLVVAQRLIRKVCPHCKGEANIAKDMQERVKKDFETIPPEAFYGGVTKDSAMKFYAGKGCPRCGQTGYLGRSAIVEAIDINKKVKDLIITGFRRAEVEEELVRQKFITMKQDGIIKSLLGITSLEEILMASEEK